MNRKFVEEKTTNTKNALDCFPGRYCGKSGPYTESMTVVITPHHGSVWVFSLPLAIALIVQKTKTFSHSDEATLLRKKWKTKSGISVKPVEPNFSMKGFAIGWKFLARDWENISGDITVHLCVSPEVTAAVLARIESGLLLVDSNPVLSVDRLLEGPFAFSEPILNDSSLFKTLKKTEINQKMFT